MSKIYVTTDIHGDFKPIRDFFKSTPLTSNDVIIITGDAGLNYFFNYRDKNLKEKLKSYNCTYFITRGNHEERPSVCMQKNPKEWHEEIFWGGIVYVENKYPYIKYALDIPCKYKIPKADGGFIETLVLPGAYSVDKMYRIANGWGWFEGEQCTKEEMAIGEKLAESQKWDLILSHTCPTIYEPTDLFLRGLDQSTVDKTTERWLNYIDYKADYKLWLFGHFHKLRYYPKYNHKQIIMLFNDCFFDIYKYFCGNYSREKCTIQIKE